MSGGPCRPALFLLISLALLGLGVLAPAQAQEGRDTPARYLTREDARIAGVLSTIFEREWGWGHDSYRLVVDRGVASLRLLEDESARRERLATELPEVVGLEGVNVVAVDPAPPTAPERAYSILGLSPDTIPLPAGDLFQPLLADPKQPQFFVSLRSYSGTDVSATTAAVGYGETFGLVRRAGKRPGDGLQVSIAGGLFAQFNLEAESDDLVNADYTIGIPVTYRRGASSLRLRLYHQSSHLGDEFLLRVRPERVNLSFESLELLFSREWLPWRVYLGGEYLFRREPDELEPGGWHGGVEYRGERAVWRRGRLVGGVDWKSWEEHDWAVDTSLKLGLEFGATDPGRRRLRLMGEVYEGHAPHGQFYEQEIRYLGVGLYFGF